MTLPDDDLLPGRLVQELMNAIPVPLLLVSASEVILFANRHAEALFPAIEMQGVSWQVVADEYLVAVDAPSSLGPDAAASRRRVLADVRGRRVYAEVRISQAPLELRPAGSMIHALIELQAAE